MTLKCLLTGIVSFAGLLVVVVHCSREKAVGVAVPDFNCGWRCNLIVGHCCVVVCNESEAWHEDFQGGA